MRFYLAGVYTSNFHKGSVVYNFLDDAERRARDSVTNFLESYHYIGKGGFVARIRKDGVRVFLDSGAYSSMSKGIVVDLPRYVQFIRQNEDIVNVEYDACGRMLIVASVLDAIGDVDETWRNQKRMEDLGVAPLPCFHYGEPEEALEYYLENYEYITLGGMVPVSKPQLRIWLDRLWSKYLTHPDGTPKAKVHGFGVNSLSIAEAYPWYSVDASTWVQAAAMGGIMLPEHGVLTCADGGYTIKDAGRHLDNLTDVEKDAVYAVIRREGFDPERLRLFYQSRWAFNCWSYKQRLDHLHENPRFVLAQPGLF